MFVHNGILSEDGLRVDWVELDLVDVTLPDMNIKQLLAFYAEHTFVPAYLLQHLA